MILEEAVPLAYPATSRPPGAFGRAPPRRSVRSNLLKRHVGKREAWSSEHEAAEERQIDAARHLQQRVEVGNWIETAEPAGKTGTAPAAKHGKRVEHDAVTHQVEHRIDLLRLRDVLP